MRKPSLVSDWRRVLRKAWSVKLATVAAILSAVEATLTQLNAFSESPSGGWLPVAAALFGGAAVVARIVDQTNLPGPKANEDA